MILDQIGGSFELAEQIGQIFFFYVFGYLPEFKYSSIYCLLMVFRTNTFVKKDIQIQHVTIVKLRSRSRSGEGQVRVRKVRVRSESCELKDLNKNLRTWT